MRKAVDLLKCISTSVFCKKFNNNNMIMIYSQNYSEESLSKVLQDFFTVRCDKNKNKLISLSLKNICELFRLRSVLLGKLLVDELVLLGHLCVDEGDLEISYYQNMF